MRILKIKNKTKLGVQFKIFAGLFVFVEIVLRIAGMSAGVMIDDFEITDEVVYEARFYSDEVGVNHLVKGAPNFMPGFIVNDQGFRGDINYTKKVVDSIRHNSSKKIIMIIGDSYVEGCCPDNVTNSFPDIINREEDYVVFNFGVSGTDPLQYELVAKKYVGMLQPDLVVTVFYIGNDILFFERKATPGIPLTYPLKNNKWIYAVAPDHLSRKKSYVFKDYKESYDFYVKHYSLKGKDRTVFEKGISYSVIFSKIYLHLEHKISHQKWWKDNPGIIAVDGYDLANRNLKAILKTSNKERIPNLFVGIPAPAECEEENLIEKYKMVFKGLEWYIPTNLKEDDYDGLEAGNHFTNEGHKKYAVFLKKLIDNKVK